MIHPHADDQTAQDSKPKYALPARLLMFCGILWMIQGILSIVNAFGIWYLLSPAISLGLRTAIFSYVQ